MIRLRSFPLLFLFFIFIFCLVASLSTVYLFLALLFIYINHFCDSSTCLIDGYECNNLNNVYIFRQKWKGYQQRHGIVANATNERQGPDARCRLHNGTEYGSDDTKGII